MPPAANVHGAALWHPQLWHGFGRAPGYLRQHQLWQGRGEAPRSRSSRGFVAPASTTDAGAQQLVGHNLIREALRDVILVLDNCQGLRDGSREPPRVVAHLPSLPPFAAGCVGGIHLVSVVGDADGTVAALVAQCRQRKVQLLGRVVLALVGGRAHCVSRQLHSLLGDALQLRGKALRVTVVLQQRPKLLNHALDVLTDALPGPRDAHVQQVLHHGRDHLQVLDNLVGHRGSFWPSSGGRHILREELQLHRQHFGLHRVHNVTLSPVHVLANPALNVLNDSCGAEKTALAIPILTHLLDGCTHLQPQICRVFLALSIRFFELRRSHPNDTLCPTAIEPAPDQASDSRSTFVYYPAVVPAHPQGPVRFGEHAHIVAATEALAIEEHAPAGANGPHALGRARLNGDPISENCRQGHLGGRAHEGDDTLLDVACRARVRPRRI
mmetsp:Transcript_147340/g.473438  ORF Transcript_147340/g.473438 Transcript_147340/m.473438 type:complete len:440 (+) Transcript_147340:1259-2578(+)